LIWRQRVRGGKLVRLISRGAAFAPEGLQLRIGGLTRRCGLYVCGDQKAR
jgi:hypothetical protein